jgi:putative transposase
MANMEREKPQTGEIYHVYNRGVDKRDIFMNTNDYARFVHDLWEFNDHKPAANTERKMFEVSLRTSKKISGKKRERFVDILAWCLMPNHFHLMLRQRVDDGIPNFMRKLGTGYTNAFNLKQERSGSLFQGVYKFKHVNREEYLLYLPHYIHLNPIDLAQKNDPVAILKFLDAYQWSSFQDYCGKKNFPSLITSNFANEIFKSSNGYRKDFVEWFREGDNTKLENILLD